MVFTISFSFCQVVYERVLIPIEIYRNENCDSITKKEAKTVAQKNKMKDYLIGKTWYYNDECKANPDFLKLAIEDSLKWVKIDYNKIGSMSYTLTSRSIHKVKALPINMEEQRFVYTINNDKNIFSENDTNVYLQVVIKVDKQQTKNPLFQTFKEAIYFIAIDDLNCQFFTNPLLSEKEINEVYKKMRENVQYIGKAMNEQKDNQNQKITAECKYKNMMMFDAMQVTTVEDIKQFLSYCVEYPNTYRRNRWSLPEVYATWLVAGMPLK